MPGRLIRAAVALAAMGTCLTSLPALASSHREAPAITETPKIDGSDFYMFRSYQPGRGRFVTFIANYQPLQPPYGGPNYFTMDPDAIYEIHIDSDGDAVEDITFQFDFDNALRDSTGVTLDIDGKTLPIALRAAGRITGANDAVLGETEAYSVAMIRGDRRSGSRSTVTQTNGDATFLKPLDYIGEKTFPNYGIYADSFIYNIAIPGCGREGKVFVGQRRDGFAVNLGEVFDLVNFVPIEGDVPRGSGNGGGFPGGITQDRANDDVLQKLNVTSIAIEVPIGCLTTIGNGTIGAWTTASLPQTASLESAASYEQDTTFSGDFVQRSRLSNPLVNELVIGLPDKNLFNAVEPTADAAVADYVTNPTLPAILNLLFRDAVNATLGTNISDLAPSNFPRTDLVAAFLTGFPGLNQQQTVTPSEMLRLNTAIPPTPRGSQNAFGVLGEDLAGFPNGRRPGDDVVDLALRVVMGSLCHAVPLGDELGAAQDAINLGYCRPADAPVGNVPFTDGAPVSDLDMSNQFPYLLAPLPGSPN